jgi:hypothetical protein
VPGRIPGRHDLTLFGESPTRVVVTVAPGSRDTLEARCGEHGVPLYPLGVVGAHQLGLQLGDESIEISLPALRDAHEGGLLRALGYDPVGDF